MIQIKLNDDKYINIFDDKINEIQSILDIRN